MAEPTTTSTADAPQVDIQPKEKQWGRVLLAGGTDWARLGKKEKASDLDKRPDLLSPHILRSLANVEIASIHSSACSCHCIAIATDGTAWMFGRNSTTAMGVVGVDEVSENAPRHLTPQHLKAAKGTKFVHAACGRGHSLLVGSGGELWSVGTNTLGQCGHSSAVSEILHWRLVDGPKSGGKKENVVKAACGVTFSIVLTDTGKVYSFGSGEKGQLGNGRTGEHITAGNKSAFDIQSDPVLVKGLQSKNIVDIAAGNQHSIVIDSEGYVYVFGYNGYCRLGLGDQQDALVAKVVPQFAGQSELTRGAKIAAGPSSSAVIDRNGMYWMAGKWKNSGEGSSGQPYTTFKYIPDIMGCKMILAKSGGVTHFATCPDDDIEDVVMTVAWGQNAANGELGLGEDQPRSATKPMKMQPLSGIDIIDIAAAQNTTFFLARPSEKVSELPRHPELENVPEECVVCKADKGDDQDPLLCEKCDMPYHPTCLNPPLISIPEGEWFCPSCTASPGAPMGPLPKNAARPASAPRKPRAKVKKEKEEIVYEEDYLDDVGKDDDDEEKEEKEDEKEYVEGRGRKRKAGGAGGSPKKRR